VGQDHTAAAVPFANCLILFKMEINVSSSLLLILVNVVVEQLDDQVDVGQDHTAAAVPFASQLVECH